MHRVSLRVDGVQLSLRLVQPEDAAYIHELRTDPAYNGHLSTVTGTVEDQRNWIEVYKTRETVGTEFYFVIERKDQVRCDVVRLYGSLIITNRERRLWKAQCSSIAMALKFLA